MAILINRPTAFVKYGLVIALVIAAFIYGVIVGQYKVYPYAVIVDIKSTLTGSKFKPLPKDLQCPINSIAAIAPESIIIAGHAYSGSEDFLNSHLLEFIRNNQKNIKHIVFTGDVLAKPTLRKWDKLSDFLDDLNIGFSIAPGNHDVGFGDTALRDIFEKKFKFKNSSEITLNDTHFAFIVEDSTLNNWKLSEGTLSTLNEDTGSRQQQILLRHHMPVKELLSVANGYGGYRNTLHSMKSLNASLRREVTIIAGDSGQRANAANLTCLEYGQVKVIASGLGNLLRDEILVVNRGEISRYKIRD